MVIESLDYWIPAYGCYGSHIECNSDYLDRSFNCHAYGMQNPYQQALFPNLATYSGFPNPFYFKTKARNHNLWLFTKTASSCNNRGFCYTRESNCIVYSGVLESLIKREGLLE